MAIRPQVPAPDWSEAHHRGAAKCRRNSTTHGGPDLFFENDQAAMDFCNGRRDGEICPRRNECLRTAMQNRENYGIWGGMSPAARLTLRLRYPGMPERWIWRAEGQPDTEELLWLEAS
jgi:hypothetical protein